MQYKITALRSKVLPKKAGGTWTKIEIKTDKTGEEVLELGYGINGKDTLKVGSVVEGYIERKQWGERNGVPAYNIRLNGITAEYVYQLLLTIHPELASAELSQPQAPEPVAEPEWSTTPEETSSPEDIGF